jgi:DNA-binding NtrC family response regulator
MMSLEGNEMKSQFSILIADRNRHIREFLRREFVADGYTVQLVKDDRELLSLIDAEAGTDLLILDLEMPYSQGIEVLELLLNRRPLLPVIIHTLLTDQAANDAVKRAAAFLEKRGNNIDSLKDAVSSVLRKAYPDSLNFKPYNPLLF